MEEIIQKIYDRAEELGISLKSFGVLDDEDLQLLALRYFLENLEEDLEIQEYLEEDLEDDLIDPEEDYI